MALEQNLILNLPLDEADGSTIAYDFAANRRDATVENCAFVPGKQGNCIRFDGKGHAKIGANFVPLNGNFTVLAWVKVNPYADGATARRIGIFCNTAQLDGSRAVWIDITPDSWGFFTVRKAGNVVSVYLDTQVVERVTLPATLTGIALLQDVYSTENGYADLDEVKIYNVAMSDDDIAQQLNTVLEKPLYFDPFGQTEFTPLAII